MTGRIREVWAHNVESEMAALREAIIKYPYVAMDTEFPGIVARPIGTFKGSSDYHYQTLRCNVDLLKLIQLGITLSDENGELPPPNEVCTWQFNFSFSVNDDMCAPESLELLHKAGLDFERHERMGIDVEHFGELLITSGLALFDDVKWVSFHSGYDFGYLLKVVTCSPLPSQESDFFTLLRLWFPCVYDIKYLMRSCKTLKGGLQDVADDLGVSRIGQQHQAGSDSLLTANTFFKLRNVYFDGVIDDSKYLGCLYGFSTHANRAVGSTTASTSAANAAAAGVSSSIPTTPSQHGPETGMTPSKAHPNASDRRDFSKTPMGTLGGER
ncbi:CAF1-domain-containing protein [Ceraceosorus guamensis]|uniref:poly(A)-specific ribonuclease n=1 Tax=Ceraceosorus guamensis TaxID=1522189 RepID=A0A316VXX0_9BASI|nr:CAF1-domain-containing protein [Ceraceosorus guamensis]PWN41243.1 CAF1-domain-containing protein [Ceraceosorus guamensis]